MKIGVLGTGHVGMALGTGLSAKGHDVMLGSRDPGQQRLEKWVAENPEHRRVGDQLEATRFGEMVMMAVPGRELENVVGRVGTDTFYDKIVVDVTNPFGQDANGDVIDVFGDNDSGAEYLQRTLPDTPVVKAFNEINYPAITHPEKSRIHELRIAGDNEDAKCRVADLAQKFGWEVVDVGGLEESRALEHAVVERYARV